jgi:hypothetical protein
MASNTTSGWANTNTAEVKPRLESDTENGGAQWGDVYVIECTWRAPQGEQRNVVADAQGREVVPHWVVYTEDVRPQIHDLIRLNSSQPEWAEILDRNEDDMSMFDEPPAFELRV